MTNNDSWPSPVRDFRVVVTSKDRVVYSQNARKLRDWMAINDHHRPLFHFTAPEGWINDPNGPIYHDDAYHIFYQYRPVFANGAESEICWGHAVSSDLVHWQDWPVAIWPDSRYDVCGVYSGNTFIDDNNYPCAMYTGNVNGHKETYGMLARSTDGWVTWQKHKVMGNEQRPNIESPVHWDGQIWKNGDKWHQLIGGSLGSGRSKRGAAHLWTSTNLEEWTHQGVIAEDKRHASKFWELPYLVSFGDRAVLMIGANNNPYWSGTYDAKNRQFHPDTSEPKYFDKGLYYCVNPNMIDKRGKNRTVRRIVHGWIKGPRSPADSVPYWIGAHTIPRTVELCNDTLRQSPISEIEILRGDKISRDTIVVKPDSINVIGDFRGDAFELQITIDLLRSKAKRVGALICMSVDRRHYARVWFEIDNCRFGVDRLLGEEQRYVNQAERLKRNVQGSLEQNKASQFSDSIATTDLHLGTVKLRIFLDRSIVEIFCQGTAITDRLYPKSSDNLVDLFAEGGVAYISNVTVWKMNAT